MLSGGSELVFMNNKYRIPFIAFEILLRPTPRELYESLVSNRTLITRSFRYRDAP